jgi:probable HAF family extracellular repeat protein
MRLTTVLLFGLLLALAGRSAQGGGGAQYQARLVTVKLAVGQDYGFAVNDKGMVAATEALPARQQSPARFVAFTWKNGHKKSLPAASVRHNSGVQAVNNNGDVAGWSQMEVRGRFAPSVWYRRKLTTIVENFGAATGFDASGVVCGYYVSDLPEVRAFLWNEENLTFLPPLFDDPNDDLDFPAARARGISDGGIVVGDSKAGEVGGGDIVHAVRWVNGVPQDLGTLGGAHSEALGISRDGAIIVGEAQTSGGVWRAATFGGALPDDLGTLGGESSRAWAVGPNGDIVGEAQTADGSVHAFIRDGTGMHDLNAMVTLSGVTLTVARGINARGQIVCAGKRGNKNVLYLLTPSTSD